MALFASLNVDVPSAFKAYSQRYLKHLVFGPATDGGYWLIGAKRISAVPQQI